MLSGYAKNETKTVMVIGVMVGITSGVVGWWWLTGATAAVTAFVLAFFRDPDRRIPADKAVMVSPADGRISSVHDVEHFEAFDGPGVCVRIFLSLFDVHVNRSPCHAAVASKDYRPGKHMNVLNPVSAEANEASTIALVHPVRRYPIAAVRQIAGMIARTIVTDADPGRILQRGQRIGIIKFGSTVELYVPKALSPQVLVKQGQRVQGGQTILARITQPVDERPQPVTGPDGSATKDATTDSSCSPPEQPISSAT